MVKSVHGDSCFSVDTVCGGGAFYWLKCVDGAREVKFLDRRHTPPHRPNPVRQATFGV
jgi:hypothetical protein